VKRRLRAFARRNRVVLIGSGLVTAAAVNAAVQVGVGALIVLTLAGIGCALAVLLPALLSGAAVVRHADRYEREIEAAEKRKGLTR